MAKLLRMPEVAASAVEAVLAGWPVSENTPYAADDAIATVETEKAVVDVLAEADGVILRVLVPAGADVEVGAPIALLGDPGEIVADIDALLAELGAMPDPAATASSTTGDSAEPATSTEPTMSTEPAMSTAAPAKGGRATAGTAVSTQGRLFSSPLARRLAKEAGLSLDDLRGTGRGGRIVRRDVERGAEAGVRSPDEPAMTGESRVPAQLSAGGAAAYEDVPHTRMRRAIAARLTESTRDAPHFYVKGTARVDRLLKIRARLNDSGSLRVSVNDLVVMAAARAHVLVPAMNVIWTPDAVRSFRRVDISIAVATERGLVTPVLRGVDEMSLSAVATASGDLVSRARAGTLRQDELEGGTLTVTNLGVFGTEDFAAIINPPQSAILAVGAARQEPVVSRGRLKVGTQMRMTLSVDHRPIDGAVAAQWMAAFVSLLEEPVRILV